MPSAGMKMAVSVGQRLNAKILCPPPDIKDMTAEQLAAMHVFKHEVLGATFRLYMSVPQELADPILKKFFRVSPGELEGIEVQET